jgi:hypothetical protein
MFIPMVTKRCPLRAVVLDSKSKRVIKHSIALGKRYAMLLDVCRILLRVETGGHLRSICTLYIHVNAGTRPWLSTNVRVVAR